MSEDKLPSKKHVQVPNNMTKNSKIEPRDLLVYSVIKNIQIGKLMKHL